MPYAHMESAHAHAHAHARAQARAHAHTEELEDGLLRRLLWDEYPHVKRCVKRVLEDNLGRKEQAYPVALQRALDLYASERRHRAATADALALRLDMLGHIAGSPFPCPVAATLFTANYDVQSLLVSQDPLVKRAEEFLRATIETLAHADRFNCRFDTVLAAYLDFAARHRERIVAQSPHYVSPEASPTPTSAAVIPLSLVIVAPAGEGASTRTRKLPLGLQSYTARLGGAAVVFPTAAAWAAFVANKTLWVRLVGAPAASSADVWPLPAPLPAHPTTHPTALPPAAATIRVAGKGRASDDEKWATVRTLGCGPDRSLDRDRSDRGPDRDRPSPCTTLFGPRVSGHGSGHGYGHGRGGYSYGRTPPTPTPTSTPTPSAGYRGRPVFLLAPDVDEWEARHAV